MSARRIAATVGIGLTLMLASSSPALAAPPGPGNTGNPDNCPTSGANASPNNGGCVGHFLKASSQTNT